jgi:predicted small lipoprotein YifL
MVRWMFRIYVVVGLSSSLVGCGPQPPVYHPHASNSARYNWSPALGNAMTADMNARCGTAQSPMVPTVQCGFTVARLHFEAAKYPHMDLFDLAKAYALAIAAKHDRGELDRAEAVREIGDLVRRLEGIEVARAKDSDAAAQSVLADRAMYVPGPTIYVPIYIPKYRYRIYCRRSVRHGYVCTSM